MTAADTAHPTAAPAAKASLVPSPFATPLRDLVRDRTAWLAASVGALGAVAVLGTVAPVTASGCAVPAAFAASALDLSTLA